MNDQENAAPAATMADDRVLRCGLLRPLPDWRWDVGQPVLLARAHMERLGVRQGSLVKVSADSGRSAVGRLIAPEEEEAPGVRMSHALQRLLSVRLGDTIGLQHVGSETALSSVRLASGVDLALIGGKRMQSEVREVLARTRAPLSRGLELRFGLPSSHGRVVLKVADLAPGEGIVDDATVIDIVEGDLRDLTGEVSFEDVGGLDDQVQTLRELVQLPLEEPAWYEDLGIAMVKGVLLHGPPGSGKTLVTRALAAEVRAHFVYVNGPDLVASRYGESEANLRRLFTEAALKAPSVLLFDEIDAIAVRRGESGAHADTRLATQLLSLLDGFQKLEGVIVIGTTNRIESIDPAFRRPGRFDREVMVRAPSMAGRLEILRIHTRGMPLSARALAELDRVAERTSGFVGADLMGLCREAGLEAARRIRASTGAEVGRDAEQPAVEQEDFEAALVRARPAAMRSVAATERTEWSEVGGLTSTKRRLLTLVRSALWHPGGGTAARLGILLAGPSGVGKTLLASAVATEVGASLVVLRGSEVYSKWLGQSEEAVRETFRVAGHLAPSVLLLDQLDALAPLRTGEARDAATGRVVSQILAELDGLREAVVVLATTDRPDLVEPTVLRSGRLGVRLDLPLPDASERAAILRLHLTPQNAMNDPLVEELTALSEGMTGADLGAIADVAMLEATDRSSRDGGAEEPTLAELRRAVDLLKGNSGR